MDEALLASLEAAVEARPQDIALRLHLVALLIEADRPDDAIRQATAALAVDPASGEARKLMARAIGAAESAAEPPRGRATSPNASAPPTFDWRQAEEDLGDVLPPTFVDRSSDDGPAPSVYDVEPTDVRLSDVGGMATVKKRLEAAFLAPMRNPELQKVYGKSLRGGLLLYGPPGCGKTFLAQAVAGELGAGFLAVSLADVLDMWVGNSEKNVHELFEVARANAPCVLFFDELDGIGQRRSLTRNSGTRTTVNQLLTELDGVARRNTGVFVLAATNHPWDVDPALRRPGRLDRSLLVLPPDREAREAIFRYHLKNRPVERIDVTRLARRTEGFSGADIAHVCDSATETALVESAESGMIRTITMVDLEHALSEVRPSIRPWLETARNVALFANQSGEYDELATFLRKQGLV